MVMSHKSESSGRKNNNMAKVKKKYRGKGIVNWAIKNIPFEMHIPGYHYCGPGTKLRERLAQNDPGVNELDRPVKNMI